MLPSELNQKYELRGTLGRGAMGVVYEATDRFLGRSVAIKVVKRQPGTDAEGVEADQRFRREAQAAGQFTHPNVVLVYDYGENADQAWIVMEKVEGGSLKERFDRRERFPMSEVVRIMDEILRGLAYAHTHGVAAHRDIKPANIMLTHDGTVKIADFGIARTEGSHLTQIGALIGTPTYMAPEQFRGEPVDLRTDIWAAGVVLYQLLTDEKPFDGANPATVMHRVLNTEPQPPSTYTAMAPRAFDAVIARALAKRPEDRFPNALAFAEAIRAAAIARVPDPPPARRDESSDATIISSGRQAGLPPLPGLGPNDGSTMGGPAIIPRPTPPPRALRPPEPPPRAETGRGGSRRLLLAGLGLVVLAAAGGGAWFTWKDQIRQVLHLAQGTSAPPRTDPPTTTDPRPRTDPPTTTDPRPRTDPPTTTDPRPRTDPPTTTDPRPRTDPPTTTDPRPRTDPPTTTDPRPRTDPPTTTDPRPRTDPPTTTDPRPRTDPPTTTDPRPSQGIDTPTTPGGPRPGAVELRAAGQAAAQTPCSLLTWSATDQILTVRGVLRRSDVAALGRTLVGRGAPDSATRLEVQPFDGPYCDALELFRPVLGAFGAAPGAALMGQAPLASGERIRIAIDAPDWPSYLYVGYLDTEGKIAHLVTARQMRPRERFMLGEAENYTVGPPFGTDLTVVISTEQPLFGPEPLSDRFLDFLPVLSRALAAQMQRQQRIAVRPLVVETVERRR